METLANELIERSLTRTILDVWSHLVDEWTQKGAGISPHLVKVRCSDTLPRDRQQRRVGNGQALAHCPSSVASHATSDAASAIEFP
jgi:hypothetical protein